MLVWVVASRITLRWCVWRYPQVLRSKASPLEEAGGWMSERQNVFAWQELIADSFAKTIANVGIDDLPIAARQRVNHLLRFRLAGQQCRFDGPGVAIGVFGA